MFKIYWTETSKEEGFIPVKTPKAKEFDSLEMTAAMKFMEELRKRIRAGEPLSHVVLSSENPNSVGESGVAETGPDYNWTKRRYNERPV